MGRPGISAVDVVRAYVSLLKQRRVSLQSVRSVPGSWLAQSSD